MTELTLLDCILFAAVGIYLAAASVSDIRTKKVPVRWMAVLGVCFLPVAIIKIFREEWTVLPHILGAAFGSLFLLVGYVTEEALGYADGWSLVLAGLYLGLYNVLLLICISLAAGTIYSVILLCLKKAGRKDRYPFLPFLGIGYVALCALRLKEI